MAVAVVNSDLEQNFHLTRRRRRRVVDQQDLSCGTYQARYLVSTHSSQDYDQKYFASRSARSRYVSRTSNKWEFDSRNFFHFILWKEKVIFRFCCCRNCLNSAEENTLRGHRNNTNQKIVRLLYDKY
jgi:hypothetical protein